MESLKRYRVELVQSLSHDPVGQVGRKFVKGQPQIVTSPAEVAYYKTLGEFNVTRIRDPKPAAVVTPKAVVRTPSRAPSKTPPPVIDEDDDEDDEDNEPEDDDEDDESEEDSDEDDDSDEEEEEEESQEATGVFNKKTLSVLSKPALVEIAKTEFNFKLNETLSKQQMIVQILRRQIARTSKEV